MVQPGVSALGKKKRTTALPRKSFSETFFPFSSGKVKSGALSLVSMAVSPCNHCLYRRPGWGAILLLLTVVLIHASQAQYAKRSASKGPRALGLLELAANGKAHLIPIAIMSEGKFYDAGAYKAAPVPMALEPQNVYEAVRSGISQGLFTITGVRQLKTNWIAEGTWLPAGSTPAKRAHSADEKPVMGEEAGPPVLRRTPAERPNPENKPPESKPPETKPPEAEPSSRAPSESSSASVSSSTSSGPTHSAPAEAPATPEDKDRPVLHRGKPAKRAQGAEAPLATAKAEKTTSKTGSGKSSAPAVLGPSRVQLIPAISDAGGPEPRPYTYDVKAEEEQKYRKKLLALAAEEISTRAKQLGGIAPSSTAHATSRARKAGTTAQPSFDDVQLRFFDLSNTNEPILVLTATAHMPRVAGSAPAGELQYFITLVAHADIYGELRKLFSNISDTQQLDAIPRMELIDAVDADGDGRAELLFREISDAGTAFNIYRVTGDQLWPVFDGAPQ
jgi:hypothetical protein